MPKLKISETEEENRRTRAIISYGMSKEAITDLDIAKRICHSDRTVRNKKKRPETFTLSELRILVKLLKLNDQQIVELVGIKR